MVSIPHLICRLHDALYAVDARAVKEIFGLPELTPVEQLPGYVVGVVNLRGTIVPVLDLDRRFGRMPPGYDLTNVVVVLARDEQMFGLIVDEVKDVQEIAVSAIDPAPSFAANGGPHSQFISGLAKVDGQILMVLDYQRLYTEAEPTSVISDEPTAEGTGARRIFWPQATAEQRGVLAERAQHLVRVIDSKELRGQVPLAAVVLSGEHFGVDLELIQEFSELARVTPVPCCPSHIAGQINLRGDIVTLVDIGPSLNLAPAARDGKVMVVELEHLRVGIPVDDVSDVIYLRQDDVAEVPATVKAGGREFLKGAAPHRGKMLSILDLRALFANGDLAVNEEV